MAIQSRNTILPGLAVILLSGPCGTLYADSVLVQEVEVGGGSGSSTAGDKASNAWEATRETAAEAAEYGAEKGVEAWEATKKATAKGADYVGEKSSHAWEATKKGAEKAADTTVEAAGKAWSKTKEAGHDAVEHTSEMLDAMDSGGTPLSDAEVVERSVNGS